MPIEAVKIPQNVYIEDRIVGPLTLRQTLIMVLSGGVSYALYTNFQRAAGGNPGIVYSIVSAIPFLIGTAFALVKINDLSLMRICFLLIEKSNKPSMRVWGPRKGITISVHTGPVETEEELKKKRAEEEAKLQAQMQRQQKIGELSTLVDRAYEAEQAALAALPQTDEETSAVVVETSEHEEQKAFPVNPNRIAVDEQNPINTEAPDLKVFRDIFPSQS